MTPDEQGAFLKSIEHVRRIVNAHDTFVRYVAEPPKADSAIARAYETHRRDAFDLAELLLFAAGDHLRTVVAVADTGTVPSFALFTLLRSAAEAAVRVRHLLEPQVDDPARLARSLNERLSNLLEQGKVVLDDEHLMERVRHLEQRAQQLQIEVRPNKQGKTDSFGEPRESMVALFERYLKGGATGYRVLSAYAHSMQWMLVRPSRAKPSAEPDVVLVSTQVNTGELLALMDDIVDLFDADCGFWVVLAGQPLDVWSLAKQGNAAPTSAA
jgi:hypothetical protein